MRAIIIKVTDDEYKRLEEEARKEGYVLLSDYIKHKLFSSNVESKKENGNINTDEILKKLERRMQDMINPFTAEVETIKKKIAELAEKLDSLQVSEKQKIESKEIPKQVEKQQEKAAVQQKPKKSVMEILKERGAIYESEEKLKNPDAFFEKIEREGGKVLFTERERIAMDPEFYDNFIKKLSEIHTSDEIEAQKFLTKQEHKLFQKLRSLGIIYFDASARSWKISAQI